MSYPFMSTDHETLAGNWLTVAYALYQAISDYGVLMLACVTIKWHSTGEELLLFAAEECMIKWAARANISCSSFSAGSPTTVVVAVVLCDLPTSPDFVSGGVAMALPAS